MFYLQSLQTKEHVAVDLMQLIEHDKSEVKDEMNDQSWSIARDNGPAGSSYHQESAEVSHQVEGRGTIK